MRIWARTPRDVREILEEVVKGNQVRMTDFNGLVGLVAELENFRRQAALNGDEAKFDEPETIMAIIAARLTCLEAKWSKHAIKKRNRGEEVKFTTLIAFIEDEAAALEEPEGAKARARAHEFVGILQKQPTTKKFNEKDKWGGRGGRFEPLIVNAAQVSSNNVPLSQGSSGTQSLPRVAASSSIAPSSSRPSSLSSQATSFVPTPSTHYSDRRNDRRSCAACKLPHSFYSCNQYLAIDATARRSFAARHNVCFKCANSVGHGWRYCSQTNLKCFWCHSANHHSTLHVDDDASQEPFTDARLAGGAYMLGSTSISTTSPKSSFALTMTPPAPSS